MYSWIIRPWLFRCRPEWVHRQFFAWATRIQACPWALASLAAGYALPTDSALTQSLWGYDFCSPVGLAAGFDKNLALMTLWPQTGLGFAEVGSISARPWPGNPPPRLFRLPKDEALINRMGLNNAGIDALASRITRLSPPWPVGISVVKTPDPQVTGEAGLADLATTIQAIHGHGAYVSLNLSCPNTSEGKTFEVPEALEAMLTHLRAVEAECVTQTQISGRPWLLKVSPDLSATQLQELVAVGQRHGVAGWIATNTTASRPKRLKTPLEQVQAMGPGGLSGAPLRSAATWTLTTLYQLTRKHPETVLIGVGGVMDVDSAWEKITHGATLVQVYTGIIYRGPGLIRQVHRGLHRRLSEHGLNHLSQAVGLALRSGG